MGIYDREGQRRRAPAVIPDGFLSVGVQRHKREESRRYQRQPQEPFWIPEIGLGIGRAEGELGGIWREWLAWRDEEGQPYPLPEQLIGQLEERLTRVELELAQARQRAEAERREKLRLRERLLELGVELKDNGETAP